MSNSTHKVEVVPVVLEPHPAADRLSVVRVWGYTCVVATDQWQGVPLGAYLPPDSVVDTTRPEFAFLAKDAKADGLYRVRGKKIRGVLSFGLLVPAAPGKAVGDDVTAELGVTHYEPPVAGASGQNPFGGAFAGGETAGPPPVPSVKYDLEAGRKYAKELFRAGEPVVVTEKIHGASGRYCFADGRMHCGSRNEWKKERPDYSHVTVEGLVAAGSCDRERAEKVVERLRREEANPSRNQWWRALDGTPGLELFCTTYPGTVVYGEVYGMVGGFPYDARPGEVRFRAFDIMRDGAFLDFGYASGLAEKFYLPWVPVLLKDSAFDFDLVCAMAEGRSTLASHVREGVVVKPVRERADPRLGRVALKWVGVGYLEKGK